MAASEDSNQASVYSTGKEYSTEKKLDTIKEKFQSNFRVVAD